MKSLLMMDVLGHLVFFFYAQVGAGFRQLKFKIVESKIYILFLVLGCPISFLIHNVLTHSFLIHNFFTVLFMLIYNLLTHTVYSLHR